MTQCKRLKLTAGVRYAVDLVVGVGKIRYAQEAVVHGAISCCPPNAKFDGSSERMRAMRRVLLIGAFSSKRMAEKTWRR